MRSGDVEPKRTVAYYLPVELVEWVRDLARARRTNASYEAQRLLELARAMETARDAERTRERAS